MDDTKILASLEAEQAVLGSVFYDESTIKFLKDKILVDEFYYARHKHIYEAMISLFNSNTPIDLTTVITYLQDKNLLAEVGGREYIMVIAGSVPTVSNVYTYVQIVKDKYVQRNVVAVCNDIIKATSEDISDNKQFLDYVEHKIYGVTSERSAGDLVEISSILEGARDKIQQNSQKEAGALVGLDTGFEKLNKWTLGLQPSELIILAARPSMGKTALALNIATNIAKSKDKPYVAFFSLEMGLDQLALRLLSSVALIPQQELKTGHFYSTRDPWEKINFAITELENCHLMFDESGTVNIQDLRSMCRKKKAEGKLDFVCVDYLQLLSTSTHHESRVQEVNEISRTLKEMARELQIPVMALSQLSRAVDARQDKTPVMSDLRESGSIEQDADIVMFIYREAYYDKQTENQNIAKITIAKNRNGMVGDFNLMFKPELTTFENLEEDED